MSRFARPAEDEIIEDSEPEREEQRIRRKIKRKILTGRTGVSQKDVLPRKRSPCHEVIVISDESEVVLDNLKPAVTHDVEVQLEATDTVLDEPFSWDLPEHTLPSPILNAKSDHAQAKSRDASPVTVRTTSDTSEREESPEKPRKLPNFAQYAYTGSRASSLSIVSRPSLPRGPSILSRDTPEVTNPPPLAKPKPKAKPKPAHRFTAFKDSELAPLRKCVSCELSWTLRKTVAQKMKHIQTCARKNKLEDDTVIALIRAELARTLEVKAQGGSGLKAPAEEVAVTLLENVVQVEPKKKGRRPKVVESVKQLADTRESILERARLLLQSQPPKVTAEQGPSKAKATPSASTSVALPPATQAFGESALAQKYRSKSKAIPDPTQPPTRVPSPPASPTFGESNLAKQFHVQASYTSYPEHDSPSSPVYIPSPLAQRNQGSDPPVLLSPSPTPRRLQGDGDRDLVLGRDNPVSVLSHPDSVNEAGPSRRPPLGNGSQDLDAFPQLAVAQETYSPRTISDDDNDDGDGIMHFEPDLDFERYDSTLGSDYSEDEGAILHYEPGDFYAQGGIHGHSSDSSSSGSLSSLGIPRPRVRRSSSPLIADDMGMAVKGKGKGKEKEVVAVKKKRRRASKALSGSDSDSESDIALLRLRPAKPSPSPSPTKKSKGTTTRKPRSKKSATRDVDIDDPAATTSKTKSTKSKTKSKGESTQSKTIQLTDDELFAKLRESILQDTELHLRVLRYEPVHFDVFLKLAGDTGVSDRGLKLRVRAFLDKQAIHFYGLVVSRSRTKKRRA